MSAKLCGLRSDLPERRRSAASKLALSLALCTTYGGSALLARVIGPDDRAALPTNLEAEFSGVGRLVCRDPRSGDRFATTATLVGDRSTVLAAGHFGRAERLGRPIDIQHEFCAFELRSSDGKRLFGSLIEGGPTIRFSANAQPDPLTPDWAILKLRTEAPPSASPVLVRPTSARDLARRPDVFMVSYHSSPEALARTKRLSPSCRPSPVKQSALVFRHSCDTAPGSSGGLLYVATPAGPRAVGINHGSSTEDEWNYGQVISSDIARNLPEGSLERGRGK